MRVGIIGLGLIGGSLARDLRGREHEVKGYDINPIHADQAVDYGLIEESMELAELASWSEFVIVAVTVKHTAEIIREVLDLMKWSTVVIDVASTKESICQKVRSHTKRGRYVACHPLAGTEFSGPKAAIESLFEQKKNIICEEHASDEDALEIAIDLLSSIGLQHMYMDPKQHDKHMAYVSHLSHVSAFTLSTTVLDIEQDQKQIFNLASTGFASTVRLAKSNPATWASIFADNADHLLTALDSYINELAEMREMIANDDQEGIMNKIEASNAIRRVLNGMKHNIVKVS
ncbi:MAG: prephenate dehydrogenase [Bacteroidota bacterium]